MQELFSEAPPLKLARVLVDGRDDMALDYAIPPGRESVSRGFRVEVPLRGGKAVGTVLDLVDPDPALRNRLRAILRAIDERPIVSPTLLDLAEWASHYYAVPVEQMIRCMVPEAVRQERHEEKTRKVLHLLHMPDDEQLNKINARAPRQASLLRQLQAADGQRAALSDLGGSPALAPARALERRGLVEITEEQVKRDPAGNEVFAPSQPLELNEEQARALACINEAFDAGSSRPLLLQGVTGSGKTEVYLQAAARAMAAGAVRGWETLPTDELCRRLCKLKGVGEKVADCIALFGFHRFDVFPSDTWIVKLYNEDFGGEGKNAKKIAAYFAERYGNNAGIFQQYLFHYKRNVKE